MEILPKDIYEYLANFADDKTIVNMLSVNKKFNDSVFFERIFKRKYPLLIRFKRNDETWKQFYLKMVQSISLLEEEYDIPYISHPDFNPNHWLGMSVYELYNSVLNYAIDLGDLKLIKHILDKDKVTLTNLEKAIEKENLEIIKLVLSYFLKRFPERGANNIPYLSQYMQINNPEIIDYLDEIYNKFINENQ